MPLFSIEKIHHKFIFPVNIISFTKNSYFLPRLIRSKINFFCKSSSFCFTRSCPIANVSAFSVRETIKILSVQDHIPQSIREIWGILMLLFSLPVIHFCLVLICICRTSTTSFYIHYWISLLNSLRRQLMKWNKIHIVKRFKDDSTKWTQNKWNHRMTRKDTMEKKPFLINSQEKTESCNAP